MKQQSLTNTEALQLLERYKSTEDLTVLGKLYSPFMEIVLAIGLKYYKDQQKAEDLVMIVYEKLIKRAKQHEVSNFSSWLYSIAKNECLMELRKAKKEFSTDVSFYKDQFMESSQMMHLIHEKTEEKQQDRLKQCLDALNDEQKLCVERFYLQNQSYKEIVAETKLDYNKVKSAIQNGKRNLKLCMEQ